MKSCIFDVFSHRPYRAHVLLDFPDPIKNQPILAFPSANLQKIMRSFKQLKNRPMAELVWVSFYWGRYNMGAIEFFIPSFILDDFGALVHVIARK